MIAAAKLARLLATAKDNGDTLIVDLIEAMEKAQAELASAEVVCDSYARENQTLFDQREAAIAERDSARALLGEADAIFAAYQDDGTTGLECDDRADILRARIAALKGNGDGK